MLDHNKTWSFSLFGSIIFYKFEGGTANRISNFSNLKKKAHLWENRHFPNWTFDYLGNYWKKIILSCYFIWFEILTTLLPWAAPAPVLIREREDSVRSWRPITSSNFLCRVRMLSWMAFWESKIIFNSFWSWVSNWKHTSTTYRFFTQGMTLNSQT